MISIFLHSFPLPNARSVELAARDSHLLVTRAARLAISQIARKMQRHTALTPAALD
jgi:hypothetical protein